MPLINQGDSHATAGPFDPTVMLERIGGDRGLFVELVDIFREDYPPLLEEIRQAIADNDADRLRLAAHTLRGAIGNFTIASPYDLAKRLESEAKINDLSDTQETLCSLTDGIERLVIELTRCVDRSVSQQNEDHGS